LKEYALRADGQVAFQYGVGSTGVFIRTSLFLIFINNLDEDINSHILKFADDTKIFKEVRNSADCSHLVLLINCPLVAFNKATEGQLDIRISE